MKDLNGKIIDKEVLPIKIKNEGEIFLTLYYFTDKDDAVLNNSRSVIAFANECEMIEFCKKNELTLLNENMMYDFDIPLSNPINYSSILNNWNMLNTISNIFEMHFEGNEKKYNALYNLLFRLSTPIEPIPSKVFIDRRFVNMLTKVFKKKNKFLKKIELYSETRTV